MYSHCRRLLLQQGRSHLRCQQQLRNYASDDVKPVTGSYQKLNHCSGLGPKYTYVNEPRTVHIQKSLENLQFQKIKINKAGVQIRINDKYQSKGTDGASIFLYEKIPVLKYHNPTIPIECTRDASQPWDLSVSVESGEWVSLPVAGKSSEEIYKELAEMIVAEIQVEELSDLTTE